MIHWVSIIIGICSLLFINEPQAKLWFIFFSVLLILFFLVSKVLSHCDKKNFNYPFLSWINWLIFRISFIFLIIILAYCFANKQISHRLPHNLDGQKIWVTGKITHLSKQDLKDSNVFSSQLTRFTLSVIDIEADNLINITKPRTIKVVAYFDFNAKLNDIWRIKLRLKSPEEIANLSVYDYQKFSLSQGIDALATMNKNSTVERIYEGKPSFIDVLINSANIRLSKTVADLSHVGLIKALVIGQRSEIISSNKYLLRRMGVSHLLAISGMHIGVAVLITSSMTYLFLMLVPKITTRYPRMMIVVFTSLPLALFYSLISGFSVPTQRALWMFIIINVVVVLRRRVSRINILFLLAVILLTFNPLLILSSAFCLSFFATFVLLYFYNGQQYRTNNKDTTVTTARLMATYSFDFFKAILIVQCILFLTMPVILSLYAGQISLLSPLANIIAVPVVTLFSVPIGLLGLIVNYFSTDLSATLFNWMNISLDLLMLCFNSINEWSLSMKTNYFQWVRYLEKQSLFYFIVLMVSILIILTRPLMPGWIPAFICLVLTMNSLNSSFEDAPNKLGANDINITQFYVGQGLSVFIETSNNTILYDTGPKVSGMPAVSTILLPYTTRRGISQLDHVIISHGDDDHSSGINFLNEYFKVERWWLGGSAYQKFDINNSKRCFVGQQFTADNLSLSFLHPSEQSNSQRSENDSSCVLLTLINKDPEAAILLTGDISKRVEKNLLQLLKLPKMYMMSAPHHGSKTSSSKKFIQALDPDYVLISAGYLSRYKHPNKTVVRRYKSNLTQIIRSDQLGTVQFRYRNGEWYGPFCIKYSPKHIWQKTDNTDTCIARLN